jgi:ATP-binding cassette, subfamily C (CFTR/MRP), member 1
LPYADHIIVLSKDGKITEQGTFSELNSTGGYVSTFDLKSAEWTLNGDEILPLESDSDRSSINKDVKKETIDELVNVQGQDISERAEDDASRRTGDTAVYMYYISAVGWFPTAVFIVCMCAFVICYSYPSRNPSLRPTIGVSADSFSQRSGSKNGQRQTPWLRIRIWVITSEYTP